MPAEDILFSPVRPRYFNAHTNRLLWPPKGMVPLERQQPAMKLKHWALALGRLALIGALSKYPVLAPRVTDDLDFGRRLQRFSSQDLQGFPTGTKKSICLCIRNLQIFEKKGGQRKKAELRKQHQEELLQQKHAAAKLVAERAAVALTMDDRDSGPLHPSHRQHHGKADVGEGPLPASGSFPPRGADLGKGPVPASGGLITSGATSRRVAATGGGRLTTSVTSPTAPPGEGDRASRLQPET
eukprot:s2295_g1.t1